MTTEYERMSEVERIMEGWAIGLTDRELSERLANLADFRDEAIAALMLEDWRRMRLRKLGAGLAVDSTP